MQRQRHARSFGGLAAIAVSLFAPPAGALDAVVGPGQCNEAGLVAALAAVDGSGGGTITFNCGTATIPFTSYKRIASAVTIDGGDRITFDGNDASAFFQVYASADVTLRRLAFKRGKFSGAYPLENFGTLTLDRVQASQHTQGSRLLANGGRLRVWSSAFTDNAVGAVANNGGEIVVSGSRFERNRSGMGGGTTGAAIANDSGTLIVAHTAFSDNQAFDGGALFVGKGGGSVRVVDSTFSGNSAGYGGAIENWGADTTVAQSRFVGNQAQSGDGGAIWSLRGVLNVSRSQFLSNGAVTTGGAISCYESAYLFVHQSAFGANQSGSHGGAIHSSCGLMIGNSTFSANQATGASSGGGAIHHNDTAHAGLVLSSTLAGNTAAFGGGIYGEQGGVPMLVVGQSILSGNGGGNCAGVLGSSGLNLSSDTHCGGVFTTTGDLNNVALALQPFGSYGGPTSTMPPKAGNPAIDRVPAGGCGFAVDQRGAARPAGAGCDSGAVELGGLIDAIFADGFELP